MPKALRPTTIIPQSLYVERAADRQLRSIVSEMGRPGYVLVARQMGKTNLLINMKRQFEREGALVPYFDLSNRFDTIRSLFRHVVDQLLESESNLDTVAEKVLLERQNLSLEPNVEYDRHLRSILRAIEANVVIVLDEVDSLVSTTYSDGFFAQIRSMYFSRINHLEYNRLTYVLSGVAEPTDLIKDKAISPFNIGEKIYLEDFSVEEVRRLASKSGVGIPPDIIEEIFSWTSGNPRMTWDVMSELEDRGLQNGVVRKADVSQAVEKLYLHRFDRAPVDHIRVLVENDAQVRSAVASVKWGKGDTLDDGAKSRLYLAGITAANVGNAPKIKNRIIDAALSDSWLTQVSAAEKSLLEIAAEHFAAGQFGAAVAHFESYIADQASDFELKSTDRWRLGVSKLNTGDLSGAIEDLKRVAATTQSDEVLNSARRYLGSALIRSGRFEESLEHLERAAISKGSSGIPAKITLQSAYLALQRPDMLEQVMGLSESVSSALDTDLADNHERRGEYLSSASFNVAQAHRLLGKHGDADVYFERALEEAPASLRPALLTFMLRDKDPISRIERLATRAADEILVNRLALIPGASSPLELTELTLADVLLQLLKAGKEDKFRSLLSYIVEGIYAHSRQAFDVLVYLVSNLNLDRARYMPLLWLAIDSLLDDTVLPDHRLSALRMLARYAGWPERSRALDMYKAGVQDRASRGQEISIEDVLAIHSVAQEFARDGRASLALDYLATGLKLASSNADADRFGRVILLNSKINILQSLQRSKEIRAAAAEIIAETESGFPSLQGIDGQEFEIAMKSIRDNALRYRPINQTLDPYRHIGRNAKVLVRDNENGKRLFEKFKKVEGQIRSGKYSLVISPSDKD